MQASASQSNRKKAKHEGTHTQPHKKSLRDWGKSSRTGPQMKQKQQKRKRESHKKKGLRVDFTLVRQRTRQGGDCEPERQRQVLAWHLAKPPRPLRGSDAVVHGVHSNPVV